MSVRAFFAYTAAPAALGETIERAVLPHRQDILSWRALDIAGHFIAHEIETSVDEVEYLIADITFLNFNVTYELGYAIGRGKRVFPVRNRSFQESSPTIREVGLFDTLGYKEYENAVTAP